MADVRDGIPSDMYQKWERVSDKSILVKTRAKGLKSRAELLRTDNMVLTDPPQAEIVKKHKSQHRARYFLSGAGFLLYGSRCKLEELLLCTHLSVSCSKEFYVSAFCVRKRL